MLLLDVLLFIDCIAAVAVTAAVVLGIRRELAAMPPYSAAVKKGLNYNLGKRLQNALYNRYSSGERVTEEIEYEAYRQEVFSLSLLRLAAVNLVFAAVADLCCFFDGYAQGGYTLGVCIAACGLAVGIISGILLGLYLSRLAFKAELVETISRADSFVREDGSLKRSSRNCYLSAYLMGVPACCLLAATVGFTVYTIILMLA